MAKRIKRPGLQRIGVQAGTRYLRLERVNGVWRLWTHHNVDVTLGKFIELHDNGRIDSVTVRSDELDERHMIKPPDIEVKDD